MRVGSEYGAGRAREVVSVDPGVGGSAELPDVQLAELGLHDAEAGAGRVPTEDLLLRLLRRCWSRRRLLPPSRPRVGCRTRTSSSTDRRRLSTCGTKARVSG